jgi:DNA replication licensing factor MCM5
MPSLITYLIEKMFFEPNKQNKNKSALNSPEAIAESVMTIATTGRGEMTVAAMKKYVQYCKARCSPRLTVEAGEILTSSYVKIRDDVRRQAIAAAGHGNGGRGVGGGGGGNYNDGGAMQQGAIPITVRQLEALVRLSESLARMRLDSEVQAEDVTEALRLFRVSTMAANAADQNTGDLSWSAASGPNRIEVDRTENFLRMRLNVGSTVNKQKIIEEAVGQGFNAVVLSRCIAVMVARGEMLERNQARLLKRLK